MSNPAPVSLTNRILVSCRHLPITPSLRRSSGSDFCGLDGNNRPCCHAFSSGNPTHASQDPVRRSWLLRWRFIHHHRGAEILPCHSCLTSDRKQVFCGEAQSESRFGGECLAAVYHPDHFSSQIRTLESRFITDLTLFSRRCRRTLSHAATNDHPRFLFSVWAGTGAAVTFDPLRALNKHSIGLAPPPDL